jgi:protocatechuate 3,4-dioxygenase beta subunit
MHDDDSTIEDHDRGLAYDLPRLISRRRALGLLVGGIGAGSLLLAACDSSGKGHAGGDSSSGKGPAGGDSSSTEIPDETAGPFPGDGSNGPNALADSGVVRTDITKSFGDASGVAEGVPTRIEMTLLDVADGGTPLVGAAVYVWHCTRDGRYSMYDPGVADENYLRGVQESDKDGNVAFTSVFPAAYRGRWPHIHFEVYESVNAATSAGAKLKTSQIALPAKTCERVYATAGYEQSVENLRQASLASDIVFSDGYAGQLATASGTVKRGLTIKLNVGA